MHTKCKAFDMVKIEMSKITKFYLKHPKRLLYSVSMILVDYIMNIESM